LKAIKIPKFQVPQTPYNIPLFELDMGEEETQAVQEVLKSKWLTMGDVTRRFEEAFARFLDVPFCFAVGSGTAALHLALMAIGIGPGDEVICPSLSFVATANPILYVGAVPVFGDIAGKRDLNISPESIQERITDRTKALMVVHYGGFPCAMGKIMDIASNHGLKVIEDAAHAPGAEYLWRDLHGNVSKVQKIGTVGDLGCFSFFSNKNLATGEGGMVVTSDQRLAERIKILRSHGMTSLTLDRYRGHSHSYDVIALGYNYRIDEIRSAMGLIQLEKLSERNLRRRELNGIYRGQLRDLEGVEIPFEAYEHQSAHHIFPVVLKEPSDRATFMNHMREKGIQTSIHYTPIHQFTLYRNLMGGKVANLDITEYVGAREVTLPLYPSLTDEQVLYISASVAEALTGSER
jgi:dTDP-4-amino-4,6-dideoxygalactose transaminase